MVIAIAGRRSWLRWSKLWAQVRWWFREMVWSVAAMLVLVRAVVMLNCRGF